MALPGYPSTGWAEPKKRHFPNPNRYVVVSKKVAVMSIQLCIPHHASTRNEPQCSDLTGRSPQNVESLPDP